jgi:hypothetical protein
MAEADALALLAIARRDLQAAQGMIDTTPPFTRRCGASRCSKRSKKH